MTHFDLAIIGAGMAGASIASKIAGGRSVIMIEAEAQPGYHATGRSVAFWTESYGGPDVQPLTTASGDFLAAPPPDFSPNGFLSPRGALHIGKQCDRQVADDMISEFAASPLHFDRLGQADIASHLPDVGEEWSEGVWEAGCSDIDVAALHAAYLRDAAKNGANLLCNSPVTNTRFKDGVWHIETARESFTAGLIVNAAGAWADQVAAAAGIAPIGITPFRRTVLQVETNPAIPVTAPLVIALDGSFYFKPAGDGRIWLSPHDETPTQPCDAAPEEMDVAVTIDRFQQVGGWNIAKVEHKWAGLRSFSKDRLPVIGRDPSNPQFFWAAGQGGFGIQTAPAIAEISAALIRDQTPVLAGVDSTKYAPERFR
mgnify:CR=1 FL=1